MRIQAATRQVFLGGGRYSFTRWVAYRNEAKSRIKRKYPCECEKPEYDYTILSIIYPGMTCERHSWSDEKYFQLVNRLARFLRYLDNCEKKKLR